MEPKSKHITVDSLNEVAKYINDSEQPLIYAGGGVINSGATEELVNFAEKIKNNKFKEWIVIFWKSDKIFKKNKLRREK